MGFNDVTEAWELGVKSYIIVGQSLYKEKFAGVEGDISNQWPSKLVNQQTMRNVCLVSKKVLKYG